MEIVHDENHFDSFSMFLPQMEHQSGVLYCIDDGPTFPRIEQLLQHYMQDPDRLPCRLTDFCPRPPTRMTEC